MDSSNLVKVARIIYETTARPLMAGAKPFDSLSADEKFGYLRTALEVLRVDSATELNMDKLAELSNEAERNILHKVAVQVYCGTTEYNKPQLLNTLNKSERDRCLATALLIMQIFQDEGFVFTEEKEKSRDASTPLSIVEIAQLILRILQEENLIPMEDEQ